MSCLIQYYRTVITLLHGIKVRSIIKKSDGDETTSLDKQNKLPVSVFVITQNEENNIARLLESTSCFDEVVIVDSGSTDNTINIAYQYGARVVKKDWTGYAAQKQFAMNLCNNEWVLNLDADEELTPALILSITQLIGNPSINGVRFLRQDLFLGETMPKLMKKPNNLRLYRKQSAQFDVSQQVHETAMVEGNIHKTKEHFLHYGYNDIQSLVEKNNVYSSLKAIQKFETGKRASLLKLVLIFPIEFLRKFLLQGLIFWGRRGLILATLNAFYAFQKEAKLLGFQMQKSKKVKV